MNRQNIKQQLRRSFFVLAIVGALFTLPLADVLGTGAQSGTASGISTFCFNTADVSHLGRVTVLTADVTIEFTGTFTGTFVGTDRALIYPNGTETDHYSGVFTGTVDGSLPGAVLWNGVGEFSGQPGHGVANFEIDQGTDGLAGLHAYVTLEDPTGGCENCGGCEQSITFPYSGQFVLAP